MVMSLPHVMRAPTAEYTNVVYTMSAWQTLYRVSAWIHCCHFGWCYGKIWDSSLSWWVDSIASPAKLINTISSQDGGLAESGWVRALACAGDRMVPAGFESHCGKLYFGTLAIPFTPLCQCFSEKTLKAVGHFYLVSMPGEVKDPTSPHWNV